jgi:hypothetical protein
MALDGVLMDALKAHLLALLNEASTVRGLILFASGAAGLDLSETDVETLTSAGLLLAGLVGTTLRDRRGP